MGEGGSRALFIDKRDIAESNGGSRCIGGMDRLRWVAL